jgi:hypothetical protein
MSVEAVRFIFVACVLGAIRARAAHVHHRRIARRAKAILVLTQLAQCDCDLKHFQQICQNAQHGKVNQADVLALTADATLLENVKYLIGLYARSATTRGLVNRAGAVGISTFLSEQEKA